MLSALYAIAIALSSVRVSVTWPSPWEVASSGNLSHCIFIVLFIFFTVLRMVRPTKYQHCTHISKASFQTRWQQTACEEFVARGSALCLVFVIGDNTF